MQIQQIGESDGHYDVVPKYMGDDMLCIRSAVANVEQKQGSMVMLDSEFRNTRMLWYEVVKEGHGVEGRIGVKEGDYVFVDMLGRFADTHPVSFVGSNNVLFKTDVDGMEIHALNGRVILDVIEPKEVVNSYGFVQKSDIDPYGVVVSIGDGCEDRGFKVGDKLSVQKCEDCATYMFRGRKYFDFPYTVPAVKFVFKDGKDEECIIGNR